jgi:HSP20 family protein
MEEKMSNLKINNNSDENLIHKMQKQIENLYENIRGVWPHGSSYFSSPLKMSISPRINITESQNYYTVAAELPGVEKNDITLNIENDTLILSAEKKFSSTTEENEDFYHVEHGYGAIKRVIKLPNNVDKDSLKAKFNNGLLEIKVNKTEEVINSKTLISIE